jgi:hypothetical protein
MIEVAGMKFLRSIKWCATMDMVRNEDTRKELDIVSI